MSANGLGDGNNLAAPVAEWVEALHFHIQRGTGKPRQRQGTMEWSTEEFLSALSEHGAEVSPNTLDSWRTGATIPSGNRRAALFLVFWPRQKTDPEYQRLANLVAKAAAHRKAGGDRQKAGQVEVGAPPTEVEGTLARQWTEYHEHLGAAFDAPIPGEDISLRKLYVPLRSKFFSTLPIPPPIEQPTDKKKRKRRNRLRAAFMSAESRVTSGFQVTDLASTLRNWLSSTSDPNDTIRLIRGGPGSGKSTFAKFFCDDVANDRSASRTLVLYVPLQKLNLDDVRIPETIDSYFQRANHFATAPLEHADEVLADGRALIVIDGLDEVSRQSRASDKSHAFVEKLRAWLSVKNEKVVRYCALVLGRDAAIEQTSTELSLAPRQAFYLLPYRLSADATTAMQTPTSAMLTDQRSDWWEKWRQQRPRAPMYLPSLYNRPGLIEISSEPLLLYLLSREEVYRTQTALQGRKKIYDLLVSRITADWHNKARQEVDDLPQDPVITRLLEIIGAAAWANNGRLTNTSAVQTYCEGDAALQSELQQLIAQRNLQQALLAFYFDVSSRWTDLGIEFTHRSFGEYLAAKFLSRRVHECAVIAENDLAAAVAHWVSGFRGAAMTTEIAEFLSEEVQEWPEAIARNALAAMLQMIGSLSARGPYELQAGYDDFSIIGAVQALFFISSRLNRDGGLLTVEWHESDGAARMIGFCAEPVNLGQWHWRVAGKSYVPKVRDLFLDALQGFRFDRQILHNLRFAGANLFGSSFVEANCAAGGFIDCVLCAADFACADLSGTVWNGTNVSGANFAGANLRGADLRLINGYTDWQFDGAVVDANTQFPEYLRRVRI